jgi:predicted nucleic acid-binding protein
MSITSNTSPIIALAKIGRLKMLKDLYGTVVISRFVKVESVDRGKELGATDALEIERAINEGWIKVADLTRRQKQTVQRLVSEARVGLGEAEALTIARDEKIPIILDDKEARAIAKSWDLELTSTVMVLYEAFIKDLISYDELVEDLAKLTRVTWISTDVITEVIKRAKKVVK